MKTKQVDLVIIGAGTAGLSAFKEAKKVSNNILLIDHGLLGTTCARVGCMPSKLLIQAANSYYHRYFFKGRGIEGGDQLKINIPDVLHYVRKYRDHFTYGIIQSVESLGDQFIHGNIAACEPHCVTL